MLLPISHEKMTVRRVPIVTVTIIVLTVLLHGVASFGAAGREERAIASMLTARLLYLQRPSLGVCASLKPFVGRVPALAHRSPDQTSRPDEGDETGAIERYGAACQDLAEAFEGLPAQRFGYLPSRPNYLGLLTHMFVHGDWWHVLGNMWFLFLCGLALEDRWGRLAFAAYYLVGGVVAAGAHQLASPASDAALIGASGAVAASMGAFLVLFATTKIRFVGLFAVRVFSFAAPAYVMLPVWAAVEILYGLLASSSGTAHWAHVGGFVFGAAVAGVFRMIGVDRKLDDAVERAAVLGNDPRVDAARTLIAKGETAQAVALLEGLAKEKPESVHVWETLRDAARAHGDTTLADHAARTMTAIAALRQRPTRPPEAVADARGDPQASKSSSQMLRHSRPSSGAPRSAAVSVSTAAAGPAPFFPPPPEPGTTQTKHNKE